MESRIARLEEVEEPRKEWQLQFSIGAAPRSSAVVATLRDAVVHQGDFTLGPVNLQLNAGERIGITGPNGAGKSTLLRAAAGRAAARRRQTRPWAPRWRSAKSTRPAGCWPATSNLPTPSKPS